MTVQPVQLSLTPEDGPVPTPAVAGSLPPSLLDTATEMLGRLDGQRGRSDQARTAAMSEGKVTASHLARAALVYVRQSTLSQVERNRESTARQYDLVARATELGWPPAAVRVIDDDLGVSGASVAGRTGFAELAAQVGLGQVGIVVALEVSRLARNNSDWYKLLDLAGMTDTLIADADGLYHPALFNDRLLLGMKGTMSEAELHILRARLDGGIRNKAARGELRRGLPVGLIWADEPDGEICLHPDEAVTGVLTAIFERFATAGSVRATWLWLREQGLQFPLQPTAYLHGTDIVWVEPTYHAVHNVLTHPGLCRGLRLRPNPPATLRRRRRRAAHPTPAAPAQTNGKSSSKTTTPASSTGQTYQSNQARIGQNIRPMAHEPGTGAVREGCALLQGLATCGTCGRKLAVYYDGPHKATPGYYCTGTGQLVEGRGTRHMRVGGAAIDAAVAHDVHGRPRPRRPAGMPGGRRDPRARPRQRTRAVATPSRDAPATRQPRPNAATAPSTPTTGSSPAASKPTGSTPWPTLAAAESDLARHESARPKNPHRRTNAPPSLSLGENLDAVWSAPTTTDKDRKQLLHTLLDEVNITIERDQADGSGRLVLRWKGGAITELSCPSSEARRRSAPTRTPSNSSAVSPSTTPTPRSPGS